MAQYQTFHQKPEQGRNQHGHRKGGKFDLLIQRVRFHRLTNAGHHGLYVDLRIVDLDDLADLVLRR